MSILCYNGISSPYVVALASGRTDTRGRGDLIVIKLLASSLAAMSWAYKSRARGDLRNTNIVGFRV